MNNNSIREAKRHICGLYRSLNGVSFRDFAKIRPIRDVLEAFIKDDLEIHNRTQEKPENGANERKDESPGASQ